MKISNITSDLQYNNKYLKKNNSQRFSPMTNLNNSEGVSFTSNPLSKIKSYLKYKQVQNRVNYIAKEINKMEDNNQHILFRNLSMEDLEGLQYGIKAFKDMSMKDIQYLCENLHVIAVKRGCKNMCGYCYADAKPSKREMSWEDFTTITNGIKEIRKRLHYLPIYGENHPVAQKEPIYRVTELFYDADCMDLAIKDKHNKTYDFIDMLEEINALGRKSCFDTSGWLVQNPKMQARAEKYAEYFSHSENMDKLEAFNISFNVFNASNVAAVKALKNGDKDKAIRLREKYTDRIANAIYTFTPLLESEKFGIMVRSFGFNAKNAKGFDIATMVDMINNVKAKLQKLYNKDLSSEQKFVKTKEDIKKYMSLISKKMEAIDTGLNSSGRMQDFMKAFGIKAPMQNHNETTPIFVNDLKESGRYHHIPAHKLIDTDGKVYHMDYARFFPTEIQLNIIDKSSTPKLANLQNFTITNALINQKEYLIDVEKATFN